MNASSDVSTTNRLARSLEDAEARRLGIRTIDARKRLAGRIGISPGTLENLRRMRTKIVPNWLMNRLREELVSVLQSEIQRLQHEINIARQVGLDSREDALLQAETQIATARKILDWSVK